MSNFYICTAARSWILREPSLNAAQETELLFGHGFAVEKTKGSWAYGQSLSPLSQDVLAVAGQNVAGYKGWVKRSHLSPHSTPASHYVNALKAPIFTKSSIKSRVRTILPLGSLLRAGTLLRAEKADDFYRLQSGGYVHQRHIHTYGDYPQKDFVTVAESHLGLPYIWGGISSDGLDCSGLVQTSLRATGIDCARDAGQQEKSLGVGLNDKTALRRGDLVFWPGHVGIMRSADTLLHANAHAMKVALEPIEEARFRIGEPSSIKRLSDYKPNKV